jgi:hypothetical protein
MFRSFADDRTKQLQAHYIRGTLPVTHLTVNALAISYLKNKNVKNIIKQPNGTSAFCSEWARKLLSCGGCVSTARMFGPERGEVSGENCVTRGFKFVGELLALCYWSDQVDEGKMGSACNTNGNDEKYIRNSR